MEAATGGVPSCPLPEPPAPSIPPPPAASSPPSLFPIPVKSLSACDAPLPRSACLAVVDARRNRVAGHRNRTLAAGHPSVSCNFIDVSGAILQRRFSTVRAAATGGAGGRSGRAPGWAGRITRRWVQGWLMMPFTLAFAAFKLLPVLAPPPPAPNTPAHGFTICGSSPSGGPLVGLWRPPRPVLCSYRVHLPHTRQMH